MIDDPIRTIAVPTPFGVGTVNAYLLGHPPLTLVDVGPNYPPALASLDAALARFHVAWTDIGRVLITHHHVDHVGLAQVVKERSGAEIVAHSSLARLLPNVLEDMKMDEVYAERQMLAYGLERRRVRDVLVLLAGNRRYACPVEVDRLVDEGDVVGGLRIVHRPGHSFSDIVFDDGARGVAFVGDHLLARISSNALLQRSLDGEPELTGSRTLIAYRRSLERSLLDLPAVAYPGHGPRIDDPATLIRVRLAEQDRRTEAVLAAIRTGEETVQGLIDSLWPHLDTSQLFLAFSEILGHLGRLTEQSQVDVDNRRRWVAV